MIHLVININRILLFWIDSADGKIGNITSLKKANSTKDVIWLIVENKLLNENDVFFMQFICKQTNCKEFYEKCAEYASTQEMLCFFESATGIFFIIFLVPKRNFVTIKQFVSYYRSFF